MSKKSIPFLPLRDLVRRGANSTYTYEYGVKLRRLLPWPGIADTKRHITEFGMISVLIESGQSVDEHSHDEEEMFCVVKGVGTLALEGETTEIYAGDVIYIPRFAKHSLANNTNDPFVFIDLYWDQKGKLENQ